MYVLTRYYARWLITYLIFCELDLQPQEQKENK